jgi:hypothetical protein
MVEPTPARKRHLDANGFAAGGARFALQKLSQLNFPYAAEVRRRIASQACAPLHTSLVLLLAVSSMADAGVASAVAAPASSAAVKVQNGKNLDAQGNPTYKISPDGTVDWYTHLAVAEANLCALIRPQLRACPAPTFRIRH